MKINQFFVLLLALMLFSSFSPLSGEWVNEGTEEEKEQKIPLEMIQQTLVDGVKYLFNQQSADGFWYYGNGNSKMFPIGVTSLVLYSLTLSGISSKDPKVQSALVALLAKIDRLDTSSTRTYDIALAKMALEIIDRKKYRKQILKMKGILINRQAKSGGWDYVGPSYISNGNGQEQRTDWSNTQFAVLGLAAAERAESRGYAYKNRTAPSHWSNMRDYILNTQIKSDGGWPYCPVTAKPQNLRSSASMTCAGLATSLITYAALNHSREFPCGSDRKLLDAIAAGISWFEDTPSRMTQIFPKKLNSFDSHTAYRMYAMERVGFYTGLRSIGDMDWFQTGAKKITDCNRTAANGGWKDVSGAALTLLFLSKGRWPIVVQKLNYGKGWNDDALDMLRLTEKASETFERKEMKHVFTSETAYMPTPRAGKRCTWQTLTFDTPFDQWLEIPILYIVGKKFPKFTKSQIHMLKKYAYSGGTILAVAGCGSKEFDEGFKKFAQTAFEEFELCGIDRKHELFSSFYRGSSAYEPLQGIVGPHGRMMVLYSDDGLSCDWEAGRADSKEAKLGISIIKYVTDHVPNIWN